MRTYCHTCKKLLKHKTLDEVKYTQFWIQHFPKCSITTWNEKKKEGLRHAKLMNVPNEFIVN